MAKQNSVNLDITNNSDGFDISGGTTSRKLTISGGDISITSSGSATLTVPASTDTLVTLTGSQSLTNKTISFSTSATVTAGTNAQGQGALTSDYNVVTTASSSPSGVTLPSPTAGRRVVVVNKGANAVNVYPASGGTIDALSANSAIQIPVNGVMIFNASSTTQWYSTGNSTFTAPVLGTPSSGTLSGCTGLPISTGVSGLGTGVATALAVNVGSAGAPVVNGGALGTPSSGTLSSCTSLPISTGVSGLGTGVATALAVNVGSAGAPVVNGGALGTPSSGTLSSCTSLPISTGVSGLGTGVATFLATPSSANLISAITDETGSGVLVFGTGPTISLPVIDNIKYGYTSTATAAGTTTLTSSSNYRQFFTGSTTQTVVLPVATTMVAGQSFEIHNNSSGSVTVQTSGGNSLIVLEGGKTVLVTCVDPSGGTGVASWDYDITGSSTSTGTGFLTYATSPTFTTSIRLNAQGEIRFYDSDSSNYVGFKSGGTVSADKIWVLPTSDGSNGQALTTDGSGNLAFSTVSGATGPTGPAGDSTADMHYLLFQAGVI